jgi:hypothetical protein
MSLNAARLIQATNLYHPVKSSSTAVDTLIWTICAVVFLAIIVGAAVLARSREARKIAARAQSETSA